jgi:hypothetical protein
MQTQEHWYKYSNNTKNNNENRTYALFVCHHWISFFLLYTFLFHEMMPANVQRRKNKKPLLIGVL